MHVCSISEIRETIKALEPLACARAFVVVCSRFTRAFALDKFLEPGSEAMPEDMGNVLSGYPAKPKRCDRFQVHSIPKETMKKVFGIETKHIGYSGQTDSFRRNKLNSAERTQPFRC